MSDLLNVQEADFFDNYDAVNLFEDDAAEFSSWAVEDDGEVSVCSVMFD